MPVYKDKKRGTWYASVCYTDWTGKWKRKVKRGFTKEHDAKEWERGFSVTERSDCDMQFKDLTELYFKDLENRVTESTLQTKRNIFDKHILPYFSKIPINRITSASIRKWQSSLMAKAKVGHDGSKTSSYSPTYLHSIHSQMTAIMNYAVRYYQLPQNPCLVAGSIGRKKANEMSFWTDEQFEKAISHCQNPAKKLALEIMFWCGLRVGECLALRPKDILGTGIRVNKTFKRKEGEDVKSGPKTENSYRFVTAPDFLLKEISNYCSNLYGLGLKDRIFYFGKGVLNRELHLLADQAGLPRIRIHDLRHSHAAALINLGYSISAVARRLGDTEATVMNTYAHLYPDIQNKIVDDLEKRKDCITEAKNDLEKVSK